MITPQDIVQKKFKRSFRGYDDIEVDAFLDRIAEDYGQMYEVYGQLKTKLSELGQELEEARRRADEAERQAGDREKNGAEPAGDSTALQIKAAEILIKEAEAAAAEIRENARVEAEQIVREAELSAAETGQRARAEIRLLETKKQSIQRQMDVFRTRARTMLRAQLAMLDDGELSGDDDSC
ncbi:MAG: DivIVA domain-containing protein [Negativicutes bacterium]|nr:DivIVA domain-containing protein [Negativicutes bacterium]